MIVVVFEVTLKESEEHRYFDLAAELRPELEQIEGFLSVERFRSLATPNKYARDESTAAKLWQISAELTGVG